MAHLAAAFGGHGSVVDTADKLVATVGEALVRGGLSIVGVVIDPAPYRVQM
jgi:thiamine pyrophosphate-dependent acetolactate synthase large subunit-like protein